MTDNKKIVVDPDEFAEFINENNDKIKASVNPDGTVNIMQNDR